MGRLGDWDKVEKKKRPVQFSKQDEYYEYFKMVILILIGLGYLYLLWS
jgi:hypothetical protein|tara:strand:- start:5217 stop:5360 length:144 start_codon:yes stop_codon:yes gene_type:complete